MIRARRAGAHRAAALAALACVLAAGALPGSAAGASGNPANHPKLLGKPIEDETYDHATKCRPRSTPGIRMLTRWIDRHYMGDFWGVWRCQSLSETSKSLHSEGRALDWRLDAGRKRERRNANLLIGRLLEEDKAGNPRALARRMGVQEIIFNCRSWFSGMERMGPYSACEGGRVDRTTAHRDHIHIALNKRGAKGRTSFWKSGLWRK